VKIEKVDDSSTNMYSIRTACENGHTDVVKLLLEWEGKGPQLEGRRVDLTVGDIRVDSNYAIQIVKLLLAWEGTGPLEGVQVNSIADVNLAIEKAKEKGKDETLKFSWSGCQANPERKRV
jgi:hypothetical protein